MNYFTVKMGDEEDKKEIIKEDILKHIIKVNFQKLNQEQKVKAMAYIFLKVINSKGKIRNFEHFKLRNIIWFFNICKIPPPKNIEHIFGKLTNKEIFLISEDNYAFNTLEYSIDNCAT